MRFITLVLISLLVLPALTVGKARKFVREESTGGPTERRIALVIGNGAYVKTKSLTNPANDAADMSEVLKDLGFDVSWGVNQNKRQMESLIRAFGVKLASGGVGLFYYAGHGLQVGGSNYLVPVDAEIPEEDEVKYQGVALDLVLTKMAAAKNDLNIVILDACRNNPFARSWRAYRDNVNSDGLAEISPPTGTLVLYASGPGKVASDGAGRNGLFTESLLKHIKKPNVEYDQMVKALSADVWERSNRRQFPWKEGNSLSDFYFVRSKTAAANTEAVKDEKVVEKDKATLEREAWSYIDNSSDPEDYRNFLREFPSGANVANAKTKLEQTVWNAVKDSRDKTRIQAYLNEFPEGSNLPLARMKLRELDVSAAPPENRVGSNWVSMSASSARKLETMRDTIDGGEKVVLNIKYNTLDSGTRNWFTRPESGSGPGFLAAGKVVVSKTVVAFNGTVGGTDFAVNPIKILELANQPQSASVRLRVAIKNKNGDKEDKRDFEFYNPDAIAYGNGPNGLGLAVKCDRCDDSMSVLYELIRMVRSSAAVASTNLAASVPGKYVNTTRNNGDTLELRADGKFYLNEGTTTLDGTYTVQGTIITFQAKGKFQYHLRARLGSQELLVWGDTLILRKITSGEADPRPDTWKKQP